MNLPPHLLNIQESKINDRKRIRKIDRKKEKRKKWKVLRKAGGEIWEDPTLEDWPDNDYRIFCGDLGNEVTDEILSNAFRKYPSFHKGRVIRDKRTGKSKGFGFISFANSEDYIKVMREMNGKYVGNRPIRLKRSTWKDRSLLNSKSKIENTKFKKNKSKIRKKVLINNANMMNMMNYNDNNYYTNIVNIQQSIQGIQSSIQGMQNIKQNINNFNKTNFK